MVDEVTLEFRELRPSHEEIWRRSSEGGENVPAAGPESVYTAPVSTRIVLTFTGAKGLRDALTSLLPGLEKVRKEQP
jgi:hypothetical protein